MAAPRRCRAVALLVWVVAPVGVAHPIVERLSDGTEAIWEAPAHQAPAGILLAAHGCSHAASDWWEHSAACRHCIGLPEERRIVRAAQARGLVVVAVTSADRLSGCWRPRVDVPRVTRALARVREQLGGGGSGLPLYALGASSGGALALQLPLYGVRLHGIVSQVMAARPSSLRTRDGAPFPPTMFVHMQRDANTAAAVARCVEYLRGQPGALRVEAVVAPPLRIGSTFFSERIVGITPPQSAGMVNALRRAGWLDADGLLTADPRRSPWREALRPLAGGDTLRADESPLSEEMNVAWAMHEITADQIEHALDFLLRPALPAAGPATDAASSHHHP